MSHIAFYRKYRPRNFDEIVGQEYIVKTLKNSIALKRVGHSYIFAGPKGIGKTSIAKMFGKAINCLNPIDGNPCEKCANCIAINEHQTFDIHELDAASNNGVDEIRKIIDSSKTVPQILNKKVFIIDEAHMLTTQSWNALLKTVEEPPEHVVFIFATTEMYKIPETIISRCQCFQFERFSIEQIKSVINNVCSKENIKISEEALTKVAYLADGAARDALSILEQLSMLTNDDINLEDVEKVFGLVDIDNKIQFLNHLVNKDVEKALESFNNYVTSGANLLILCNDIIEILIEKLLYLQTNNKSTLKILSNHQGDINIDIKSLVELINIWQDIYIRIKTSNDAELYFNIALFKSFNIGSTSEKIEKPIIKQIAKAIPQPEIKKSIDPSQMFSTKEIFFEKSSPVVSKVENVPHNSAFSIDEVIFAIASNYSSSAIEQGNKYFNSIIGAKDQHPKLRAIYSAKKVILASNNGMVLLFDDKLDANLLNKDAIKAEFNKNSMIFTSKPYFILGISKDKLQDMKNSWDKNKKIAEPNTSILIEKDNEENISFLAKNLIGI